MEPANSSFDKNRVIFDTSPKLYDVAVASISSNGNPGQLNQYVLNEFGYSIDDLPTAEDLVNGFYLLVGLNRKPILFIVTVNEVAQGNNLTKIPYTLESTIFNLKNNLYKALFGYHRKFSNKTIWLPLMGTGVGGLPMKKSYDITLSIIDSLMFGLTENIYISIPKSPEGEVLFNEIKSEETLKQDNDLKESLKGELADEIIKSFNGKYYIAGSYWDGEEQSTRFFEQNIWENSYEEKYYKEVNSVKNGDIIILKSTFAANNIGYLRIKGIGVVTNNPQNGRLLIVDWKRSNIKVDIEDLGKYRSTFARVMPDDLDTILSKLGKDKLVNVGLYSTLKDDKPTPEIIIIENPLQTTKLENDNSQKETDLLDFENDIRAFASLIALKELKPPIAIALFGKWGSGKSFFMYNLQKRIDYLSNYQGFEEFSIKESDSKILEEPFCKGVVHISFNAWSYLDANLWASLAANIFEKLDEYISNQTKGAKEKEKAQNYLSKQLTIVNEDKSNLIQEKKELIKLKNNLYDELRRLEDERKVLLEAAIEKECNEIGKNLIDELKIIENIKSQLTKYGISEQKLQELSPDKLFNEIKSWSTFVINLRYFSGFQIVTFLLGTIIILFLSINPLVKNYLTNLGLKNIIILVSITGPILIKFYNHYKSFIKIYKPIKDIKDKFNKSINEVKINYQNKLDRINKQIEQNTKALSIKNQELDKLENSIQLIEFELEHSITKRAFFDFIKTKSKDEKYDKYLSIVTTIRRDFETLSELFNEYNVPEDIKGEELQKAEKKKKDHQIFKSYFEKPLDRVVLYIDDLDRCPEERVIEVLEAVNLLMAFPLFVVVVGVDPRWVKNALIKKYTLQFTGELGEIQTLARFGVHPIHVTDYLEKIFQIPFNLREADTNGANNLINKLFENQIKPETITEKENESLSITEKLDVFETQRTETFDKKELIKTFIDSKEIEKKIVHLRPADLKISHQELLDLKNLVWLVGNNPRSIKRFANMYRIIRAHENLTYNKENERKEFLNVIFILGLYIGEFKHKANGFYIACKNQPDSTLLELMKIVDSDEKTAFEEKLQLLPDITIQSTGNDFNKYLPFVSRFSFENHDL